MHTHNRIFSSSMAVFIACMNYCYTHKTCKGSKCKAYDKALDSCKYNNPFNVFSINTSSHILISIFCKLEQSLKYNCHNCQFTYYKTGICIFDHLKILHKLKHI